MTTSPEREERPDLAAEALADSPGGKSQPIVEGSAHNGERDALGYDDLSLRIDKLEQRCRDLGWLP